MAGIDVNETLPFVVMPASRDGVETARQSDADDYQAKPFKKEI